MFAQKYHQTPVVKHTECPYNLDMMPTQLTQSTNLSPKALFIAERTRAIPITKEGLIAGFWRSDMLPEIPQNDPEDSFAQAAFYQLSYEEGFPTLPDGRPFWHKWDNEPAEAFAAFELYVDLASTGPRYIQQLLQSSELLHLMPNLNIQQLQEFYHLYYWKERARAHDLFKEAAYRHIRTRRALQTDDYLYDKSTKILDMAVRAMDTPEFQKQLQNDPKLALDVFDKMARVRRTAAGMPAAAPMDDDARKLPDFEVTMRQVVERSVTPHNSASSGTTIDEKGRIIPNNNAFLRGALNDPRTARLLQEVVIKMSTQEGATKRPRWYQEVTETETETGTDAEIVTDFFTDPNPSEGPHGV